MEDKSSNIDKLACNYERCVLLKYKTEEIINNKLMKHEITKMLNAAAYVKRQRKANNM